MTTWQTHGARIATIALLLTGVSTAQAQTTTTTRGGLSVTSVVPPPTSGPITVVDRDDVRGTCPPPTGSRLPASRDAQGHCLGAARSNPAVRSYNGNDVEATGYPGEVGAALQQLDPSLGGR